MSGTDARERQRRLAAHLRDPAGAPPPEGMAAERLAVYRELFFNNVEGLLSGFFPVLRTLYAPADWIALARAFYARHPAETPYFLEIAAEFVGFLEKSFAPRPVDPPYLRELAHYEWLELVLDIADEDIPASGYDPRGDLLDGVPVVNPLAVVAHYGYPVHRVSASNPRPEPADTWLLVWRNRADAVRFQELNAASARVFLALRENGAAAEPRRGEALLRDVLGDAAGAARDGAHELLESWRTRDLLLGTSGR